MFSLIDAETLRGDPALWNQMTRHRANQFVGRHAWSLPVDTSGREIDAFDDDSARYAIVHDAGRLRASARLRPGRASMMEPVFPKLWGDMDPRLARGLEVTRFCSAPELAPATRASAVSDLLLGLCRTCQDEQAGHLFGVVFPAVLRTIRQLGWAAAIHGSDEDASGRLLLCEWQADSLAAWNIQSALENRLASRRPASTPAARAAA